MHNYKHGPSYLHGIYVNYITWTFSHFYWSPFFNDHQFLISCLPLPLHHILLHTLFISESMTYQCVLARLWLLLWRVATPACGIFTPASYWWRARGHEPGESSTALCLQDAETLLMGANGCVNVYERNFWIAAILFDYGTSSLSRSLILYTPFH